MAPEDGQGRHTVIVTGRLRLAPFEAWIAVVAVYAGVGHWLLEPAGNAVAVQAAFPRLADLWSVLYALGGLAIACGLWRRSPRVEAFGLNLLGSGAAVSCVAFLVAGAPVLPIVIAQGGLIIAAVARLLTLRKLP